LGHSNIRMTQSMQTGAEDVEVISNERRQK
jgi:hypothetical protein